METKTYYIIEECLSSANIRPSSYNQISNNFSSLETAKILLKKWKEKYPNFQYRIVKTTTSYEVIDDL